MLHELDPNAGSVTTMTHHTLVVGGFRDKVERRRPRWSRPTARTIVFTRTREGAAELAEALDRQASRPSTCTATCSQRVRERNLHKFSSGKAKAVVATDVAARGIHVDDVGLVVHFDAAGDAKAYLHRSGRTARAGEAGCRRHDHHAPQVDEVVRLQPAPASRSSTTTPHHPAADDRRGARRDRQPGPAALDRWFAPAGGPLVLRRAPQDVRRSGRRRPSP